MRRWISSHQSFYARNSHQNDVNSANGQCRNSAGYTPPLTLIYAALVILTLGIVILICNVNQLQSLQSEKQYPVVSTPVKLTSPTVWIYAKNLESGYLNHLMDVFREIGFNIVTGNGITEWDVLWTHEYPFMELATQLRHLKPHQKVNHFPGSGFITNKVNLATSRSSFIPTAFKIPNDKDLFLNYVREHPDKLFVQKNNKHRGIKVEHVTALNLTQDGSFIQEFVHNPLLIDKRKFDIGIYTIITSIDPLRVYIHDGDALLRFCATDYHPFDANVLEKYVVGDDYTPIWKMPSLKSYYDILDFSMKESLNAYLISQGKNPKIIWTQIETAIREILLEKEPMLILSARNYRSKRNFFEMIRFDFVVDENLRVFVMEANMSPNLSSSHFAPNKVLYEQVIFNTLSLLGFVNWIHLNYSHKTDGKTYKRGFSDKNVMVDAVGCWKNKCQDLNNCLNNACQLCKPCVDHQWQIILMETFQEHMFKHSCRRIVPKRMSTNETGHASFQQLSSNNLKLYYWFKGKCQQDAGFC